MQDIEEHRIARDTARKASAIGNEVAKDGGNVAETHLRSPSSRRGDHRRVDIDGVNHPGCTFGGSDCERAVPTAKINDVGLSIVE